MKLRRPLALALLAAGGAVSITGCSNVDALIWGNDGAEVIATTEELVGDLSSGGASDLLCEDLDADLGAAADWAGRSAGEPERFFADYWEEQAALDPQWNINVEGRPEGSVPGDMFPSDIFYRETDDGLCVIDVAWSTLLAVG
ncbi:hypothetical protein ACTU6U_07425 [Microbacterium sp. A196]|uniref:hypothetical protein n=1 Tax=Microbacterium sp. A196 TaxID=3457320 RepID=UPI003FD16F6E